ncbi:MAG: hypothetical protein BGO96_00795 [Micrococcales bacterium 73-15]|uniref:peptidase inhibitor family I36 protein n=1 Tax=Salana multivorans TaxID=120377 RepID=UPI00095F34DB|nr:peptidase inhibitor family I36 protein [Salana multivorans]OJX94656.1 MAG: hypothetical protein BGO96_00795 [Micrococcales bacterium 73-15]
MRRVIAAVIAAAALAVGCSAAAAAGPAGAVARGTVQQLVDAVIAEHGGTQTAWNEVSWDGGATVLTLAPDAVGGITPFAAVGSCASGKYCAYSGSNLTGSKLTFSTCGSHSVTALPSVGSIANARSSGVVVALNGVIFVAAQDPGGWKNVSGTVKQIGC